MKTGRTAAPIELSDEEHIELLRRSRQRKGPARFMRRPYVESIDMMTNERNDSSLPANVHLAWRPDFMINQGGNMVGARGRRYKFPDAGDRSPNEPTVHCDAARIIALYNQETGGTAQRLSQTVRDWFSREAAEAGWTGVHFLADAQSQYGSGCVMYVDFSRMGAGAAPAPLLITDDLED